LWKIKSSIRKVAIVYFVLKKLKHAHQSAKQNKTEHVKAYPYIVESFVKSMHFVADEYETAERNAQIRQIAAHFDQVPEKLNKNDLERLTRVRY
jgi:hypothetical protein